MRLKAMAESRRGGQCSMYVRRGYEGGGRSGRKGVSRECRRYGREGASCTGVLHSMNH